MKFLILDAGPIISLTMNGMLYLLENLKSKFNFELIITPQVKREVIDKPLKIRKYKLEALQVNNLLLRKVIRLSTEFLPNLKLEEETKKILNISNSLLRSTNTGEKINILHEGEASCLAFANLCNCENLLVVDERTTRIIFESPKNLEMIMEKKLHMPLDSKFERLKELGDFKIIRSTELAYIAYKKDLIPLKKERETLDAILYGLKFKGTAISSSEIEEMTRIA